MLLLAFSAIGLNAQPLLITLIPDTLLCNGQSNGEIAYSISGGSQPYHYQWTQINNNFVFEQGDIELDGENNILGGNLSANGYIIQVTDADGNSLIDTAFILTPFPIYIAETLVTHPNCPDICDASINLTTGGGTGEIHLSWGDTEDTTANRQDLCEGSYSFFLIDENGCSQKGLIDIIDPSPISITSFSFPPSCAGLSDGQLQIEADGGTMPYLFDWEIGSDDGHLTGLSAGAYNVTIKDTHNCQLDTSLLVEEGLDIIPNILINYGCGDGAILVTPHPINGEEPYQVSWSSGMSGSVLYGASAGDYSLSITDVNGCMTTEQFTINFVTPLELSAHIFPVSCPNEEDGHVDISLIGGLPPFSFLWSNNTDNQNLELVAGGDYTINVLGNGCAISQQFTVPEPFPIQVNFLFTAQDNGQLSATAFMTGGTSPYSLMWGNGDIGITANNLEVATTYDLSVMDINGCFASFELEALLTSSETLFEEPNTVLYPNPVNDWLFIESNAFFKPTLIQIYDTKGAIVLFEKWASGHIVSINMSHLISGVYLVRLSNDKGIETFRVIRE